MYGFQICINILTIINKHTLYKKLLTNIDHKIFIYFRFMIQKLIFNWIFKNIAQNSCDFTPIILHKKGHHVVAYAHTDQHISHGMLPFHLHARPVISSIHLHI